MIDKNSALYSIPLATLSANKGIVINPVNGTPLAELVKVTNDLVAAGNACSAIGGETLEGFAEDLGRCVTATTEVSTGHDTLLDSYIDEISKAVSNHVSFAKNVVKPAIVEMVEDVQKGLGEVVSPSSNFKIEIIDLPKPMQNAGFETSISKFAEKPYILPEGELRLGEISPQGVLELMKTGSKEYDDRISEWFVAKGDLFFMNIWNNLFRDFKEGKPSVVCSFNDYLTSKPGYEVADAALAIHLLSRKLYDEVPENTGLSLSNFRDLVAQYREASGIKLNLEYLRYANILKNKILVAFIKPDGKEILVNGAVYRDWLNNGGTNEVLLGMLVGNKSVYNQALIDEAKEGFLKDWNSYTVFNSSSEKNKTFNRFKDVLALSFAKILADMSDLEKEATVNAPNYSEKVSTNFKDELSKLKTSDVDDIYTTCLRLICRARFYYTDAEKILVGINEAVKANPNIDIREAALLSTIEYVIDYISDQLTVSNV